MSFHNDDILIFQGHFYLLHHVECINGILDRFVSLDHETQAVGMDVGIETQQRY